jgi:hypothetical protein
MTSYKATNRWRIKITGITSDVTVFDLSNQFELTPQRISIRKTQTNSSKCYALIDGFESKEQAVAFASEWNEAFTRARISMRCEIDTTADTSTAHESNVTIESNDDDDDVLENRHRKWKKIDKIFVFRR